MDEAAVQMQVLTPVGVEPYFEDVVFAADMARRANDALAELVRRYPSHFAFFATLPLPHLDASLREAARALETLGARGVMVSCSVFDRSTVDPEFEPLYQELNRRHSVVFYHPIQNGICSPLVNDYKFTVSAGASMEDSVTVLHLIARQVPVRFPDLRFIVPHFGGLIPMLLQRLDGQVPPQYPDLNEPPSQTARRLYYDTVGWGSDAALLAAWKAFGADHLVTGSDYPVLLHAQAYPETFACLERAGLPAVDVERILHHNAADLLGLKEQAIR